MTLEELRAFLHPTDPYAGFPLAEWPEDRQGWGSEDRCFAEIMAQLRPTAIAEIGSWKGASAIHMARTAQNLGLPAHILCVDTWLGGTEHIMDPRWRPSLTQHFGRPDIYLQFLANVLHCDLAARVTPFCQTSVNAARVLHHCGTQFDLVYLDGSHEEDDVFADIVHWWPLLRQGGIMLGDDYSRPFPGVVAAVNRFRDKAGIAVQVNGVKWMAQKG